MLSPVALAVSGDQWRVLAGWKLALGGCVGEGRTGETVDRGGTRIGAWGLVRYRGRLKGSVLWKWRVLGSPRTLGDLRGAGGIAFRYFGALGTLSAIGAVLNESRGSWRS